MPPFKKHIFVCENKRDPDSPKGCCYLKGGSELKNALKVKLAKMGLNKVYRTNTAGCLDACEFGPSMVIYPDGIWYGGVQLADLDEIIEKSILGNEKIDRLLIKENS